MNEEEVKDFARLVLTWMVVSTVMVVFTIGLTLILSYAAMILFR